MAEQMAEKMAEQNTSLVERLLTRVEVVGNKLPDPAALFILLLAIVWVLSWLLSG